MKRFIACSLVCVMTFAFFAGCGEEAKTKTSTTTTTPGGKTTTTDEHKVESSGKNPPKTP